MSRRLPDLQLSIAQTGPDEFFSLSELDPLELADLLEREGREVGVPSEGRVDVACPGHERREGVARAGQRQESRLSDVAAEVKSGDRSVSGFLS
jgi:hypothetical protein